MENPNNNDIVFAEIEHASHENFFAIMVFQDGTFRFEDRDYEPVSPAIKVIRWKRVDEVFED